MKTDGLVKVTIICVKHPVVRSQIRRMIYGLLESSAVKTDLGWIAVSEQHLIPRVMRLAQRALEQEGVEAVRIYEVYMEREVYEGLIRNALRDGGVPEKLRRWVEV